MQYEFSYLAPIQLVHKRFDGEMTKVEETGEQRLLEQQLLSVKMFQMQYS